MQIQSFRDQSTTERLGETAIPTAAGAGLIASGFLIYWSYPDRMLSAIVTVAALAACFSVTVWLRENSRRKSGADDPVFPLKKTHAQAVVGFVDMTSSSALSNMVGISHDWEIKKEFFQIAARRAEEFNMKVLNHTGDGFLFIANYDSSSDWQFNIISFYEMLVCDFEVVRAASAQAVHGVETGLRFGLALGPAVVGLISGNPSFFTAVGADVNLAARLTAVAKNNQLMLTSRIWYSLEPILSGWEVEEELHTVKGFAMPIPCVRVKRRLSTGDSSTCSVCRAKLHVSRAADGNIDVKCENGHVKLGAAAHAKVAS